MPLKAFGVSGIFIFSLVKAAFTVEAFSILGRL
jgi:hypothetical protein